LVVASCCLFAVTFVFHLGPEHHMMWCWSYTEPHVTANPSVCTRWRHRLHTDRSVGFAPACVCNQSLQPVPKLHRTNQRRCPSIWARDSTATVPSRRRAASGICISQKRVRAFKKKEITQEPRTPGRGRPLGSASRRHNGCVAREGRWVSDGPLSRLPRGQWVAVEPANSLVCAD